jgi:hypothetical protein
MLYGRGVLNLAPKSLPGYVFPKDGLSRLLLLRRTLNNWVSVARKLKFEGGRAQPLTLIFKNGEEFNARNPRKAYLMVNYYAMARLWGVSPEIGVISRISQDIESKLNKAVSDGLLTTNTGEGSLFSVLAAFLVIRVLKPRLVVETGVAQGISTYYFLKALELNGAGRLVSVDHPNRDPAGRSYDGKVDKVYVPEKLSPGWLVPDSLRGRWELRLGWSSEILPTLNFEVDMFHHDSEHSYQNMMFEYEWALQHLVGGGVLSSDDVTWNGAFTDFVGRHHGELRVLINDWSTGMIQKAPGK